METKETVKSEQLKSNSRFPSLFGRNFHVTTKALGIVKQYPRTKPHCKMHLRR